MTVVSGSIPPQKSDLTRFYEASQVAGTSVFLYLAWERTNNLGNANMDFEINQKNPATSTGTVCPDGPGTCTIPRLNGDMLITYDFPGSGSPALGLNRWLTVGGLNPTIPNNTTVFSSNADCYNANKLPCWGDHETLGSTIAEGAVNSGGSVYDPIGVAGQTEGRTIVQDGFGEAAINLTAAGVVSPGTCDFGSATTFLKSRSSSSFTSEIKDFIAPVSTPIVPCQGAINVVKQAKDHNCTAANTSADTTIVPNAQCVSSATRALPGATFSIWKESNGCTGLQTTSSACAGAGTTTAADTQVGSNGTTALGSGTGADAVASTCFSGLNLGSYYVHENSAPTNFAAGADQTVSVSAQGTCSSGAVTANFTDQPLTDLTVGASSEEVGASNSRITCTGPSPGTGNIGDSPVPSSTTYEDPATMTANGLKPGTYSCTVIIDP